MATTTPTPDRARPRAEPAAGSPTMTRRVARLRQESLDAVPALSVERARLVTEFYEREAGRDATPVMLRARAFAHLLEHKTIHIGAGELIVGERGPAPKATPTYPEICCHSLADLALLDGREKTPFRVDDDVVRAYREVVIPFWQGRTLRDRLFEAMTPTWREAYDAGVFTEFMEQRAPGHTVLDDRIYRKGFHDLEREIDASLAALDDVGDPTAWDRRQQLEAMRVALRALVRFAERHAARADALAAAEPEADRRAELLRIAEVCRRVPAERPRNFHEALQCYWFVHLGVITELNTWDSFNPGHLDQHLLPFYRQGLAEGTVTEASARELLQCFWIKFNNQPAPPKVGVTAEESGTYTDFALINTGGLTPDGDDGVSELSYLILDVIQEMRLLQPSSCVLVSRKNPDRFLKRAFGIIRTGFGQPSIFNHDAIVSELVRQGKSLRDARAGGASGCVEVGAFGKEAYILTGYFNLVKILELALHDGMDPRTGRRLGPATGDPRAMASFDELFEAFRRQLVHFVEVKVRGNQVVERLYARQLPAPFLSLLIDDCIARGRDYHDGGARYDTSYIQGVGLGTLTDALTAIRHHVFDRGTVPMAELMDAVNADFAGHQTLHATLRNRTPRYGNDDDAADHVMRRCFEAYFDAVDGRPNTRGGRYRINLLPTTVHVYFGSVIGATPDGRRAGTPLSEGISPVQGMDRNGPTAVFRSAAKLDHLRTGGTLLNQKLSPRLLESDADVDKLVALVRSYFRADGHHVQFNVVDAATLRAAQSDPESHRDLIVRVAGYSDYFCDLGRALQDEIIARTEHGAI
jgi:trans-4-hydroxy-L-proline dehydratase